MRKYDYKIYIPSGNPTAIVMGIEKDLKTRKKINDELMKKYDFLEQVGFINPDISNPELVMAGGEFCGNATRSAIKYYLKDNDGKLKIKVSGVKEKLLAGQDKEGNVWVDMPIIKGVFSNSIRVLNDKSAIIKIYGITHVIVEGNQSDDYKNMAYRILKKENLLNEDAAGVIFEFKKDNNIEIIPIVYVKKINTFFYETACGSGTCALAIYESFKRKNNVDLNVLQPSGNIINVKSKCKNNSISNVRISGRVDEYQDKLINMNNNFVKYQDLINVNEVNKKMMNEQFVKVPISSNKVIGKYITKLNELEYSPIIRVRKSVLDKLNKADSLLKKINPNYQIMVVYGYRSMEKQIKYFNEEIKKYEKNYKDRMELYEFVHEKIAVPEVSGHPTGGAVDVVIYDYKNNEIIDFGTKVHDFDNYKSYVNYPNIKSSAFNNRMILRKVMMKVGFAPYDGEWWHFSFGDREWAYYYKKKKYLYSQVNSENVY